jgi:hypothetical protein
MNVALTIPGVEAGTWQIRNRFDVAAAALADRHYCRRHPSNQVGGVGRVLVLTTPCERALWVTKWPFKGQPWDGLDAYRCSYFRNEGAGLSSALIRAAMTLTAERWGEAPADGWVTWCDRSKIASANPGYCFKQAGWWLDRAYKHKRLVRLRAALVVEGEQEKPT